MAAVKVEYLHNQEFQDSLEEITKTMMTTTMMGSYSLMGLDIGKVKEIVSSLPLLKGILINFQMDNSKTD